jgi:hypothetical protein
MERGTFGLWGGVCVCIPFVTIKHTGQPELSAGKAPPAVQDVVDSVANGAARCHPADAFHQEPVAIASDSVCTFLTTYPACILCISAQNNRKFE